MSWLIRLKLNALPVLASDSIDATILVRDVYVRLGIPRDLCDKVKTNEAVKTFMSAASAEGYIEEKKSLGFFTYRDGYFWKRIGNCLVFLQMTVPGFPPIPFECIVRTDDSIWRLYDLSSG